MPETIIVIIIILIILKIYSYIKENIEKKEKDKQVKLKQHKEEIERQAKLRDEQEEAKRKQKLQEELKYELVTVVYASFDEDGKPTAILRRNNNTYSFVESKSEFELGNLKLLRETIAKLDWVDENEYLRRKDIKQKEDFASKQRIEKRNQALKTLLIRKTNWEAFQQVLKQNGIITLFHFTDRANIASIKKYGGLFSWDYCDKNGIDIPYQGGSSLSRELDTLYSLQDFVRISFVRNHPMMYVAVKEERIQDPVILKISLDVCYFKKTRFANMNATKTGHLQGEYLRNLQSIHFTTIKQANQFDLDESERPYYQAEVLVKTWLPIKYITNIDEY